MAETLLSPAIILAQPQELFNQLILESMLVRYSVRRK